MQPHPEHTFVVISPRTFRSFFKSPAFRSRSLSRLRPVVAVSPVVAQPERVEAAEDRVDLLVLLDAPLLDPDESDEDKMVEELGRALARVTERLAAKRAQEGPVDLLELKEKSKKSPEELLSFH